MVLADELRTLEGEHQNLQLLVSALEAHCLRPQEKEQCNTCDKRMASECVEILNDRLAVLIMFLMTLARHEERLMKNACPNAEFLPRFGAHVEDHANLCAELAEVAGIGSSLPPAAIYAQVIRLAGRWLNEHFATYDRVMVEFLIDSPRAALEAANSSNAGWASIADAAAPVGVYAIQTSARLGSKTSVGSSI
jgi:hemerythrin